MNSTAITLADLESLALSAQRAHQLLTEEIAALEDALTTTATSHRRVIQSAVGKARSTLAKLYEAVEAAPALFEKPKSRVIHGIKVGYAKAPDTFTVPNEEETIAAIARLLPALATVLVKRESSIVKGALKQLDQEMLLQLGVLVTAGENEIICRPVDGDIDRLVNALLKVAKSKEVKGEE